jgi:anaerobic C4-dicarboxylate transporter DcuA/anaerobic C4-dicarboxylate transporter DcuB
MLVIIAVITAASVMQAAGGIEWLVTIAKKILESRPSAVVYVAPPVSFVFTMLAGTSNIFYPLIPVIYRLCYQNGIRPEKALGPSTVASAFGITASPVSAAMAAMITLTAAGGYGLSQVLLITIPASLIAIFVFSFAQSKLGKPLAPAPVFDARTAQQLDDEGLVRAIGDAHVVGRAAVIAEAGRRRLGRAKRAIIDACHDAISRARQGGENLLDPDTRVFEAAIPILREPPLELFARRECTGAGERLRLAEQRFGVGDERLQVRQESLAFARRPGKEAARIAAAHRVGRRLRSVGPLHVSASSKGS